MGGEILAMETLTQFLWAAGPSLLVGLVLAGWNARQKKHSDRAAAQEQDRLENELMQIDLEVAAAQLAYAVAMAYKRGTPNGEMEVAIQQYEKAMDKFRKYERKQIARIKQE